MIIDITEQKLKDYMACPIFYAIRHNSKMNVEKPPTMPMLLKRIATGFCSDLKDGKVQELHILKKKWSMYCNQYPELLDTTRSRLGLDLLYRMFSWAESVELRIAAVGTPYTIRIKTDKDIIVYHGQLGIIAVNQANRPENLILDFGSKIVDQADIDLNLKTTLDHVGFDTVYEGGLSGTRVHYVKNGKDFFTNRDTKEEGQRVATIIKNVVRSIQENIWYPHETSFCKNCITRDFCLIYGRKQGHN